MFDGREEKAATPADRKRNVVKEVISEADGSLQT